MQLVNPAGFQGSFDVMTKLIDALEHNVKYKVTVLCEPQLGKRGLYPTISQKGQYDSIMAMRDLIAYADGSMDLLEISEKINVPVSQLIELAAKLEEAGLFIKQD
jgi:aminopeptidase-like protein